MLEPWIIEQIRRREEERRRQEEQPALELPLHEDHPRPPRGDEEGDKERDEDEPKRGVVIIGI